MLGGLLPLAKNTVPEHTFRAIVRSLVVFEKVFLSQDEIEKIHKYRSSFDRIVSYLAG
jgi:hypothetical protein